MAGRRGGEPKVSTAAAVVIGGVFGLALGLGFHMPIVGVVVGIAIGLGYAWWHTRAR